MLPLLLVLAHPPVLAVSCAPLLVTTAAAGGIRPGGYEVAAQSSAESRSSFLILRRSSGWGLVRGFRTRTRMG